MRMPAASRRPIDDLAEHCLAKRAMDDLAHLQDCRLVTDAERVVAEILVRLAVTREVSAGVVLALGEVLANQPVSAH
jgi:hypothetical protein